MHNSPFVPLRHVGFSTRIITAVLVSAATAACSSTPEATATTMTIVSGNNQSATVATAAGAPLVVKVTDQNGAPLSGVQVSFAPGGTATLGSPLVYTDASGNASTTIILGTASGLDSILVVAGGIPNPVTFTVTVNPGAPAAIAVISGNGQGTVAGSALPAPLVVAVTDVYGNPVPGVPVDWAGAAVIASAQTLTNATGTATDTVVLPATPGTDTITAAVDGDAAATPVKFTESAN
jgi:hypothetical protein